jgi:hypothetical protein
VSKPISRVKISFFSIIFKIMRIKYISKSNQQ